LFLRMFLFVLIFCFYIDHLRFPYSLAYSRIRTVYALNIYRACRKDPCEADTTSKTLPNHTILFVVRYGEEKPIVPLVIILAAWLRLA
jgi:hypothetical protein